MKSFHGFVVDAFGLATEFSGESPQEVFSQQVDIRFAVPQRRQCYRVVVQSVKEISSKISSRDHCFEITVCCRYDADISLDGRAAANAFELAFLQESKNLRLSQRSHVSNFVEEQCAACALFNSTNASLIGSGKRSFFVPEQLAFQ